MLLYGYHIENTHVFCNQKKYLTVPEFILKIKTNMKFVIIRLSSRKKLLYFFYHSCFIWYMQIWNNRSYDISCYCGRSFAFCAVLRTRRIPSYYYHNNSFSFTFDLAAFPSFLSTTVTLESLLAVDDTICIWLLSLFPSKLLNCN